jgi:hypothetical protein
MNSPVGSSRLPTHSDCHRTLFEIDAELVSHDFAKSRLAQLMHET